MANNSSNATRSAIERMVRDAVSKEIGGSTTHSASGNRPELLVNVSARHCHLTQEAVETLFGPGHQLTPKKDLYQTGAYAAEESVTLVGPRSRVISNLRILGPCRDINQVELAYTDAISLGFDVPLRASGDIPGTPGCMLMGPKGFFEMNEGVIRAAPHVHMNPDDAAHYGVKKGQYCSLKIHGDLAMSFDKILVRVDPSFKLEIHIDTDEGNACNLGPNTKCELITHS